MQASGQTPGRARSPWTAEVYVDRHGHSPFAKWFENDFKPYEQAVLSAAVKQVLEVMGIDI